jgi:hypothetical protein
MLRWNPKVAGVLSHEPISLQGIYDWSSYGDSFQAHEITWQGKSETVFDSLGERLP